MNSSPGANLCKTWRRWEAGLGLMSAGIAEHTRTLWPHSESPGVDALLGNGSCVASGPRTRKQGPGGAEQDPAHGPANAGPTAVSIQQDML